MTVRELIVKLQELPPEVKDLPVYYVSRDSYSDEVEIVVSGEQPDRVELL